MLVRRSEVAPDPLAEYLPLRVLPIQSIVGNSPLLLFSEDNPNHR